MWCFSGLLEDDGNGGLRALWGESGTVIFPHGEEPTELITLILKTLAATPRTSDTVQRRPNMAHALASASSGGAGSRIDLRCLSAFAIEVCRLGSAWARADAKIRLGLLVGAGVMSTVAHVLESLFDASVVQAETVAANMTPVPIAVVADVSAIARDATARNLEAPLELLRAVLRSSSALADDDAKAELTQRGS